LDDAGLEALLFPPPPDVPSDQRPMSDWTAVHRDLRRPNVTLALLWEEYRAATTDGLATPDMLRLELCCAAGCPGRRRGELASLDVT
jgi:transposase